MAAAVFLLALLVPSVLGQCSVETAKPLFSRAVYEFSVELIKRLGQETDNHFVASPLSLWTLISTVSLGAEEITFAEIKQVLKLHHHKCFNDRYWDIVKATSSAQDGTILERSSHVFIDNSMPVHEVFLNRLTDTGVCDIKILPFVNFMTVAATINKYVNVDTHGAITNIVEASDIEGVFVILVNAIFFKGQWQIPFDPAETETTAFYDEKGSQLDPVRMMNIQDNFRAAKFDQIQAKVLELPYGSGDRFSMLIFLPNADSSINSLIYKLKTVSLKSIFYVLNQYQPESIQVQLPRFKISSNVENLKELLIDMGLKSMFDNSAQFGLISDYALYVSNILQKADIEVTEEGTTAAAASEAGIMGRMLPQRFTVNKPFLYMIVDKSINIPLFIGAYSKPSQF